MVKYQLICDGKHEFEGWFASSDSFDDQVKSGHVVCPYCASVKIQRALMAPNLASPKTRAKAEDALKKESAEQIEKIQEALPQQPQTGNSQPASGPASSSASGQAAAVLPQQMMMALRHMHQQVKEQCKPVGDKFAETARKMHKGEEKPEAIYGTCTAQEKEELAEEGIEFAELPDLPADQ